MRLVLAALLLVACHSRAHDEHPKLPSATGSLVFDVPAQGTDPAVFLATQAEIVHSSSVVQRALADLQPTIASPPAQIIAARRGDTSIIDVTVYDQNIDLAQAFCNRLMRSFIEQRMALAAADVAQRMEVLSQRLDELHGGSGSEILQRQLVELETERLMHRSDVRLLDPCNQLRRPRAN